MDVTALYPNIDQQEGSDYCELELNKRKDQSFPSLLIKQLILTVLNSNTLQFGTRFYQQIKGTAMGTPMAPNFANLFMSKFETDMLQDYQDQHGMSPFIWLRFIDDVFFIWSGTQNSLQHFINFCDQYSTTRGMQSTIRFTSSYSKSRVDLLDLTVSIENEQLHTNLYFKPTATHTYLHSSSFHPPSTILSLPKAQFIRIRRICSKLSDYHQQIAKYTEFFIRRGYNLSFLKRTADEISKLNRNDLLIPKKRNNKEHDNVILSITWHPRLQFLQKLLHTTHKRYTSIYPALKRTFQETPVVAYRRNRSLYNIFVRARHGCKPSYPENSTQNTKNRTALQQCMSQSNTITNSKNGISARIEGGSATDSNVIYAARCKRCSLIYVGQTKQQLNKRFNLHRSDVQLYPDRCELPKHFHDNDCNFKRDLEVFVLENNISGSMASREMQEDKWIKRLGTLAPNGMNTSVNAYARTYSSLFD